MTTLTPNQLSNVDIQTIGLTFLTTHKHIYAWEKVILTNLISYQDTTNSYHKWHFLALQYQQLSCHNHPIATAIHNLFVRAFKQDSQKLTFFLNDNDPQILHIHSSEQDIITPLVTFSPLYVGQQMITIIDHYYCQNYLLNNAEPEKNTYQNNNLVNPYYCFLMSFLTHTLERMAIDKTDKYHKLQQLKLKLTDMGVDAKREELKKITIELKKITAQHTDVGLLGFFKFNHFRQPKSHQIACNLFDSHHDLTFSPTSLH